MNTPGIRLLRRKRGTRPAPAPRPRPRIVEATNSWTADPDTGEWLRVVLVRNPDGSLERRHLADDHHALVRFLDRAAQAVTA